MKIVASSDEHYAEQLNVMLCSLFENNKKNALDITILDGGLSEDSRGWLSKLAGRYGAGLGFAPMERAKYEEFEKGVHLSPAAYYRLSIPDVLEKEGRALYLDCDMVVLGDLGELWKADISKHFLAAVVDGGMMKLKQYSGLVLQTPALGSTQETAAEIVRVMRRQNGGGDEGGIEPGVVEEAIQKCAGSAGEAEIVSKDGTGYVLKGGAAGGGLCLFKKGGTVFERLGMPIGEPYFNSGVMLLNLERWREDGTSEKIIEFIRKKGENAKFFEQDALNAVLWGKWLGLPDRFNIQCDLGLKERADAVIVHYCGVFKPWYLLARFPYSHYYHYYLKKSGWKGRSRRIRMNDFAYVNFMAKKLLPGPVVDVSKKALFTVTGRRPRDKPRKPSS